MDIVRFLKTHLLTLLLLIAVALPVNSAELSSKDTALAIGEAGASRLISIAQNPSLRNELNAIYYVGVLAIGYAGHHHYASNPATGIGEVCAGLLTAYARNPSLDPDDPPIFPIFPRSLTRLYKETVRTIKKLNYHTLGDKTLALGLITGAALEAVSRNPSLIDGFEKRIAMCLNDLEIPVPTPEESSHSPYSLLSTTMEEVEILQNEDSLISN